MKKIDPYWISVVGIIVGALMIFYSHPNPGPADTLSVVTMCAGAALVCTGMVTLTISETFKKP